MIFILQGDRVMKKRGRGKGVRKGEGRKGGKLGGERLKESILVLQKEPPKLGTQESHPGPANAGLHTQTPVDALQMPFPLHVKEDSQSKKTTKVN
jgi:hypothetical protein